MCSALRYSFRVSRASGSCVPAQSEAVALPSLMSELSLPLCISSCIPSAVLVIDLTVSSPSYCHCIFCLLVQTCAAERLSAERQTVSWQSASGICGLIDQYHVSGAAVLAANPTVGTKEH